MKVVLTLRPRRRSGEHSPGAVSADAGQSGQPGQPDQDAEPLYDATLAVGADGCDPQFRSVVATALAGALDEVPALVAEAEARWQAQPRYPRPVPPPNAPPNAQQQAGKGKSTAGRADQQGQSGPKNEAAAEPRPPRPPRPAPPAAAKDASSGPSRGTAAGGSAGAGKRAAEPAAEPPQPRQISLFG